MTTTEQDLLDVHPTRQRLSLGIAAAVAVPAIVLRVTEPHWPHPLEAIIFGLAIVGAAFLLSWAAETAQLDISAGLAIAVLALIAVLPEYAVDMVFAWKGGNDVQQFGPMCGPPAVAGQTLGETNCSLALANMTGANRLLIGIGWSAVVFIAWFRSRRRPPRLSGIELERSHSVEVSFLAVATLYSLTLPLKSHVSLIDAAVLVSIFILYTIRVSRAPAEEPHLVGPARYLGTFPTRKRRTWVIGLFVVAAAIILLCAEHFAEALVDTGKDLGVSEFLLVQWLAPLASEAPELLVAGLYAWRLNTNAGLGTLVSSKVNQWTLLVGTLPIVFTIASGNFSGLPIESRQREEIFLTAAQSVFAVAILINLSLSVREALLLFGLFWAQFVLGGVVPDGSEDETRIAVSIAYLVFSLWFLFKGRRQIGRLFKNGFRTPYAQLE